MLQYFIIVTCLATSNGCVMPAPDLPETAAYSDECLALATDKDGNVDQDNPTQGDCSVIVPDDKNGTNVTLVRVKGNAPGYVITLSVEQQDQSVKVP